MKIKHLTLAICIMAGISFASAQTSEPAGKDYNPIITSVPSLSIAPDAAATGMGDVGAATEATVHSQYWNPAKFAFIEDEAGFAMSYTPWLSQLVSDIDLAYLTGYMKLGDMQAISASMRYFSLGEVILRESLGDVGYAIQPYEMAVDVAYSRLLSRNFSMSVAMRYIYSDLMSADDPAGQAFAADISAYYKKPVYFGRERGFWAVGVNASNIGTKISYDAGNNYYFIPTDLRIGASLKYPFNAYNAITVAADVNKLMVPTPQSKDEIYSDISSIAGIFQSFYDAPGGLSEELSEINASLGMEYAYDDQFFVRAGYHYENKYKGNRSYYTFGAGFKMSMFSIDVSYLISQAQSNPLDQTLRFTLGFDIEGLRQLIGR